MFVDTHCHIHDASYPLAADDAVTRAKNAGVDKLICVGTSEGDSSMAIDFASRHEGVYASVGVHPHDTKDGWSQINLLTKKHSSNKLLVAVGEVGLDYYYNYSPKDVQIQALESQIDTALRFNLPIIFHVRNAFDDFWPVFDNFHGIRGVVHSFTDDSQNLDEALGRNLYIGVNGISVFIKDKQQQDVYRSIPVSNLLLETDAPFLTPPPFRGKVNEPAFVRNIGEHHAKIRGISLELLARTTTANATALLALD